ncbi:unnamed protein product [Periconia digitata]|uniref:D-lactate dehydratase n=1 Tax=Periconia digitata TaxID=1303443 RepID=A0A9W4UUD2_9PLEO|nr:unnamed protein product [Periconia digitata]
MSSLPKRVFIAITSASAPLGDGQTGVFISEAQHPFNVFRAAGFEVDIGSEHGKWSPDSLSLTANFMNDEDRKQYEDRDSEFRKEMDRNRKAEEFDASKYGIFFASAGHAALIDFPTAKHLQALASKIYAAGGIVSTVCHAPAIFPSILSATDNTPIVRGKKITGFTTQGEHDLGVYDTLKGMGLLLPDEHAAALGAEYVRSEGPWDDFSVVDGRVVTGMNPQSAASTARKCLEVFKGL